MRAPWTARATAWTYAGALAAVALAARVHYHREGTVLPVDDAYITLHNADVLRAGVDPILGVPALVGATSVAHTVLVAMVGAFVRGEPGAWFTAWIGVAAYVTGVLAIAVRQRLARWEAALLLAVALVVGEVPHQLLNGLETGLAMGALAWCLALAEGVDPRKPPVLQPVLCGVLPFLRPELAAATPLLLLTRWARLRRAGALGRDRVLRDLGLCALGALPWAALELAQLGTLVPSTVRAKRLFFAEGCLPWRIRRDWTVGNLRHFSALLGSLGRAAVVLPFVAAGRTLLVFGGVVIGAYVTQFPGALAHYEHRYLYVLLPFVVAAIAEARTHRWAAVRWAALLVAVVALDTNAPEVAARWRLHRLRVDFTRAELAGAAQWVRTALPRGARVMVHDVGYVAYAGEHPMVDLVGLKTPAAVTLHQRYTWAQCGAGRAEAVHRLALQTHPTHLLVLDSWDALYKIVEGLQARGWRVEPVRTGTRYLAYALTPPP